jgi:hypothetical protein
MQLNPQDLVVVVKLALEPGLTFQKRADSLRMSVSAVHRSVTRAKAAGLLLADRQPNPNSCLTRTARTGFLSYSIGSAV